MASMHLPSDSPDITALDYIFQTFPMLLYLHTRNDQTLEVTRLVNKG